MSVSMTIDQRGLQRAMATYARLKGKSDADVVNKGMRFWLPFAGNKMKYPVTPGPARLRRKLINTSRAPKGTDKQRHQLKNSVIEAIVAKRLKDKHGSVRNAGLTTDQFYQRVEATLNAKVRSADYIRSGFIPAYRQFAVPARMPTDRHKRFKGRSKGIKAVPSLLGTVTAFATNQREGAMAIAPDAFRRSIPEVRRQFLRWIEQDTQRLARQSGFY